MNEDLEYNFLHYQFDANNKIRAIVQYEITTLLSLVHQKRQLIDQLDHIDRQNKLRLDAINSKDKILVKHELASGW